MNLSKISFLCRVLVLLLPPHLVFGEANSERKLPPLHQARQMEYRFQRGDFTEFGFHPYGFYLESSEPDKQDQLIYRTLLTGENFTTVDLIFLSNSFPWTYLFFQAIVKDQKYFLLNRFMDRLYRVSSESVYPEGFLPISFIDSPLSLIKRPIQRSMANFNHSTDLFLKNLATAHMIIPPSPFTNPLESLFKKTPQRSFWEKLFNTPFIITLAAAAIGLGLGIYAKYLGDQYNGVKDYEIDYNAGKGMRDKADRLSLAANIFFGLSGVALIVSIFKFFEKDPAKSIWGALEPRINLF